MATKKKSDSGKRIAKRVSPEESNPRKDDKPAASQAEEKTGVPERIQEKDSGFGTIKVIVGVIVALIIGAGVFARYTGSDEIARGDLLPGEQCDDTQDCSKGNICYAYKGGARRCYTPCTPKESNCDVGYTCTSSATMGKKKTRLRSICVEDAKI